jgi:hypothetical protein
VLTPGAGPASALEENELGGGTGLTDGEDGGLLESKDVSGGDAVRLVLEANRSARWSKY